MDQVQISLMVLLYTTAVVLIVVTIFLVRLINTSTKLAKDLSKTTKMVEEELEPTLKELKITLGSINSVAKSADNQISKAKKVFENIAHVPFAMGKKMKGLMAGLMEGLSVGIKLFRK